ncbi:hypothetical protein AYO41_00355 [Verrucomicrobia bacterium SCGC AG-212-E04]|nr:hypothetical protein AYO41_00355 [Verrucomicrobia bacterium SCGC AG-212-E04]
MALNPQQVFANHVLQKVVPSLQGNAAVATQVSNLEWNAKKFLGQVAGETLDATTYGERTRADLAAIAAALGAAAGADVTSNLAGVAERFGLSAATAVASAPPGGSSVGSGAAHVGGASTASVDVDAMLAAKAETAREDLDWQNSVVDLLKLLGKDSSMGARKRYMAALGLDAHSAGSEEGNTALHGALLSALAANSGNLPANVA